MKLTTLLEALAERAALDPKRVELLKRWRELVNMGPAELRAFVKRQTEAGRERKGDYPGLTRAQAQEHGVKAGVDSAEAIIRMKGKSPESWTDADWKWAGRQVSFISRMLGNAGPLRDGGEPTRKLLALKVWGHDPEK
jgi:hypothetical protein